MKVGRSTPSCGSYGNGSNVCRTYASNSFPHDDFPDADPGGPPNPAKIPRPKMENPILWRLKLLNIFVVVVGGGGGGATVQYSTIFFLDGSTNSIWLTSIFF